jgi:nucleotide-binding universal stress UspA family protein
MNPLHPMARVLVAYDASNASRSAVRAAAQLLPDASAVVLHVYDQPPGAAHALAAGAIANEPLKESLASLGREVADQAEAVAEEGRALAAEAGVAAVATVRPTRRAAWHEVLEEADRQEADLIVSGTRGQGAVGRALLGSTSSSLVHQAERPVMIVPEGEHDLGGPVALAYDGSDDARSAIATAGRLFPGREAVIVHAWAWPLTDTLTERALLAAPMVRDSGMVEALREAAVEAATRVAEEGCHLAEQHGLNAQLVLRESTEGTWRAVVTAADELNAAVVIAGSRGLGAMKSVLLGSVSSALAHGATRATLIVPAAG